jgi:hypothetical protein
MSCLLIVLFLNGCGNSGCGDVIPPAPEIKIPISIDAE